MTEENNGKLLLLKLSIRFILDTLYVFYNSICHNVLYHFGPQVCLAGSLVIAHVSPSVCLSVLQLVIVFLENHVS